MQEAARSRYNDVLDFDSSSAILKIEWREEGLGFTAHVQPFLSPVPQGQDGLSLVIYKQTCFLVLSVRHLGFTSTVAMQGALFAS